MEAHLPPRVWLWLGFTLVLSKLFTFDQAITNKNWATENNDFLQ